MVCAEYRLDQTHSTELEFAVSVDFLFEIGGSFSVLKTQRCFFTAFQNSQCPVHLSQAALSTQVWGDLLRAVNSMCFGDPMGWGSQSWDAEIRDCCPCWLMRKAAEKWNQGSFTTWL